MPSFRITLQISVDAFFMRFPESVILGQMDESVWMVSNWEKRQFPLFHNFFNQDYEKVDCDEKYYMRRWWKAGNFCGAAPVFQLPTPRVGHSYDPLFWPNVTFLPLKIPQINMDMVIFSVFTQTLTVLSWSSSWPSDV